MANWYDCGRCGKQYKESDTAHECADVLTLRAEVERLREAVEWALERLDSRRGESEREDQIADEIRRRINK